jgi:hypothetical protein
MQIECKIKDFLKLSKKEVKKYRKIINEYCIGSKTTKEQWCLAWLLSHGRVVFDDANGRVLVGKPYFYQLDDEEEELLISYIGGDTFIEALKNAIGSFSFETIYDYSNYCEGDGSSWYEFYKMKV